MSLGPTLSIPDVKGAHARGRISTLGIFPRIHRFKSQNSSNGDEDQMKKNGASKIHYTPDWFKMSIRCINRSHNKQDIDLEAETVCQKIRSVLKLRDKWVYKPSKTIHIGANVV